MTDIVERLRGLRFVHVPVASGLMEEAAAEIERLRLTDDEREAVEAAVNFCECTDKPLPRSEQITALRKMCGDSDTERCATPPRDVALSGCETVPDPDSRVWETWRTPATQATPSEGSVQDRCTLTDAEREAVEFAICSLGRDDYLNERHAEQLQETLERLKERLQ